MVQVPILEIYLVFMAFTRAGAMFFLLPMFYTRTTPPMAKVGMVGMLSLALVPIIVSSASVPTTVVGLAIAVVGEVIVGAMLGFSAKLVFYAVEFGCEILAVESALMRAQAFDPSRETTGTVLTPLFTYLAVMAFVATGMHLEILAAFVRSYELIPAGLGAFGAGSIEDLVSATSGVFALGLRMAAPLIAFAFVINFLVALLGRVASKFNVLVLSFAFRIMGGLLLVFFSVRLILAYILTGMEGTGLRMLELLVR